MPIFSRPGSSFRRTPTYNQSRGGDVFDQIAEEYEKKPTPKVYDIKPQKRDVFDQISAQPAEADIFDQIAEEHARQQSQQPQMPESERKEYEEGILKNIEYGAKGTITGMLSRGRAPEAVPEPKTGWAKLARGAPVVGEDIAMGAPMAFGGPVGVMAGMTIPPAAREGVRTYYEEGEVDWDKVAKEALIAGAIGGLTLGAGKLVPKGLVKAGVKEGVAKVAGVASEIGVLGTAGPVIQGEPITVEGVLLGAPYVMLFHTPAMLKFAGKKLADVATKRGVAPEYVQKEIVDLAKTNPEIAENPQKLSEAIETVAKEAPKEAVPKAPEEVAPGWRKAGEKEYIPENAPTFKPIKLGETFGQERYAPVISEKGEPTAIYRKVRPEEGPPMELKAGEELPQVPTPKARMIRKKGVVSDDAFLAAREAADNIVREIESHPNGRATFANDPTAFYGNMDTTPFAGLTKKQVASAHSTMKKMVKQRLGIMTEGEADRALNKLTVKEDNAERPEYPEGTILYNENGDAAVHIKDGMYRNEKTGQIFTESTFDTVKVEIPELPPTDKEYSASLQDYYDEISQPATVRKTKAVPSNINEWIYKISKEHYGYIPKDVEAAKAGIKAIREMPAHVQEAVTSDGVKAILDQHVTGEDIALKKPNWWKDTKSQFIQGMDAAVHSGTDAGRRMVELIKETFMRGEGQAGEFNAEYWKYVEGLTKDERYNMFAVLDGKKPPMNDKVKQSAAGVRRLLETIADAAETIGFTVRKSSIAKWRLVGEKGKWQLLDTTDAVIGTYTTKKEALGVWKAYKDSQFHRRKNYAPRMALLDVIEQRRNDIIAHLVNTGQVPLRDVKGNMLSMQARVELAKQQLNIYMKRNAERRTGHLQIARELDLPEWAYEQNPDVVFPIYFERALMRIEEGKAYGVKDQVLKQQVDEIAAAGGNAAQAQRMLDIMFRRNIPKPEWDRLVAAALDYQVVTKMPLSAIGQTGQFVNALSRTNMASVAKYVYWRMKDPAAAKDFQIRSGAAINQIRLQAIHAATGGSKIAEKALKKYGFVKMDAMSRNIAAGSGRFYALHLAEKLAKKPTSKFARRRLEQLDINPDEVAANGYRLTEKQLLRAGLKAEVDTNFRNRLFENPEFASSGWGRLLYQFMSFSFQQSRFIRDYIYKELKAGNPMPAIYHLAAGQVVGQGINTVRQLLTGQEIDFNALDNWLAAGTLGMFQIISGIAMYGSAPLGATVRSVANLAKFLGYAMQGDAENALRNLSKELPLLNKWLFPKEE